MRASEAEILINNSLDNIVETMVSFFGEKYRTLISNKMHGLEIIVHDKLYNQKERLELVEMPAIASDFARDITHNMDIAPETKSLLEKIIGTIIIRAVESKHPQKTVEELVKETELLNKDVPYYSQEILQLVEYYKNDSKVKEYEQIIYDNMSDMDKCKKNTDECTIRFIEENFKYKTSSIIEARQIYSIFTKYCKDDINEEIEEKFYLSIGCKGKNLKQCRREALKRGIPTDKSALLILLLEHDAYVANIIESILAPLDNYKEIIKRINVKSISIRKSIVDNLLFSEKFNAMVVKGKDKKYIIMNNGHYLYSKNGIINILHEVINEIFARSINFVVKDFNRGDELIYSYFHEYFLEYVTNNISKIYMEKYESILPIYIYNDDKVKEHVLLSEVEKIYRSNKDEINKLFFDDELTKEDLCNSPSIQKFKKVMLKVQR